MKKILLYATIVALASSCTKEDNNPFPQSKSEWTLDGVLYKGYAQTHAWGAVFEASDTINLLNQTSGNYISINFSYGYWPSKSGTYTVNDHAYDSTQCSITLGNRSRSLTPEHTSIPSTSIVTLTVSAAGKFGATFSNVIVYDNAMTRTKSVSGLLVEQ